MSWSRPFITGSVRRVRGKAQPASRGGARLRGAVGPSRLDPFADPTVPDEPITHGATDVTLPDTLFEGSADDLMSGGVKTGTKLMAATAFLVETLTEGPAPVAKINRAAREQGISEKTLNRAKVELGVESYQDGKGKDRQWFWRFADSEVPPM